MGPHPTGPVDPPCLSICIPAPSSSTLAQKPSTPSCVSVGVSPIHIQHTPLQTLVSRGLSLVPFETLLPPDIAAFFASMQIQITQASPIHSPTHFADLEVISLSSSESDSESIHKTPFLQFRTQARSLEIIVETQLMMDPLVCPHLPLIYVYVLTQDFQMVPTWGKAAQLKHRKLNL